MSDFGNALNESYAVSSNDHLRSHKSRNDSYLNVANKAQRPVQGLKPLESLCERAGKFHESLEQTIGCLEAFTVRMGGSSLQETGEQKDRVKWSSEEQPIIARLDQAFLRLEHAAARLDALVIRACDFA